MKINKINKTSVYEYFQAYSHDPYLGKYSARTVSIAPAHETMPVRSGITIRGSYQTRIKKAAKLLV